MNETFKATAHCYPFFLHRWQRYRNNNEKNIEREGTFDFPWGQVDPE